MNVLIVYDSVFGNTEKVAQAICGGLDLLGNARIIRAGEVKPGDLEGVKLLVVGSPTRGFRPTEATLKFLKDLPAGGLKGMRVAAFDTRSDIKDINSGILRFMVKTFGYAAQPIAKRLTEKGGELAAPPEGFFVKDTEGPMKDGELERAASWAKGIR